MKHQSLVRPPQTAILLFASLICFSTARGQQALPTISYEGQTVASITLIARPGFNLRALQPLVQLKPHEPYSQAKAAATAAALRSAGGFSRVDLEVSPQAEGLEVTFLLQPVYYLGIITFPGAVNTFDYAQLLDIVDYPREAPYAESQVQKGTGLLKHFFDHEGYFLAGIQPDTALDAKHNLANVVYHITLGARARFGTVEVAGPPPAEARRIGDALHSIRARLRGGDIKPGQVYHPEHLAAASRVIQDYIGNQGWLANKVTLITPQFDPRTGRVAIRFQVDLGPKVIIRVRGARVRGKTLKTLIPIYQEKSFDQDLVEEGERNLDAYFQSKGYFDVKVYPTTRKTPSEILLTYRVERGDRHTVAAIRFTGNHHLDEDTLDPLVAVQTAHFFSHGNFSRDLLNQSVTNLTNFYHNAGFESVRISSAVKDVEPKLYITFTVQEGPQTMVNSLAITGLKTQKLASLAPEGLQLHEGRPFSPAAIAHDRSLLVASFLNRGYPDVSFRATATPVKSAPHQVNVKYIIQEGPHASIRDVLILGEKQTRPAFIRRNAGIQPGEPLSEGKMLRAESALYNLGIFDWANVAPSHPVLQQTTTTDPVQPPATDHADPQSQGKDSNPQKRQADVLLKVHEAKRNTLTYGFGFLSTPRSGRISSGIIELPGLPAIGLPSSFRVLERNLISPEGSLSYSRNNLLGRDETASISTVLSRLDQHATFTYSDPQFFGPSWSSLLSLSAERTTQNPLFTARLGQASLEFERTLNSARTEHVQLRYSYERTSLSNLLIKGFVLPQDQSVTDSTLSGSFIRDTRDNPLDAHRGVFQTLDLGLTPTVLGSSDNFVRLFGQTAFYHQVTPWLVWANRAEIGLEKAFAGSHIPLSDRFFSGGADSLRGFPINGAGPQTTALLCTKQGDPKSCIDKVLVPVGGPELFILNSEGRFPIPLKKGLAGVVFYDGGNVFDRIGFSHFWSQYSNTVGFGLRYQTPVGPVRVDIGRNLHPLPGLKATQIFVTLGQAF